MTPCEAFVLSACSPKADSQDPDRSPNEPLAIGGCWITLFQGDAGRAPGLYRHEWMVLQELGQDLLSETRPEGRPIRVLHNTIPHRRDQQHLLSITDAEDGAWLAKQGAAWLHICR